MLEVLIEIVLCSEQLVRVRGVLLLLLCNNICRIFIQKEVHALVLVILCSLVSTPSPYLLLVQDLLVIDQIGTTAIAINFQMVVSVFRPVRCFAIDALGMLTVFMNALATVVKRQHASGCTLLLLLQRAQVQTKFCWPRVLIIPFLSTTVIPLESRLLL